MTHKNFLSLRMIAIALFMLIIVGCAIPTGKILFTGKDIKGDAKSGLLVVGTRDLQQRPAVLVGSPFYHDLAVFLPYSDSDTWELESGASVPLRARNNKYIVTVNIGTAPISSSQEFYEKLLENAKNSGALIRNVAMFGIPENNILNLRFQSKMKDPPAKSAQFNEWAWSYWAARFYNSKWYSVHLSVSDEKREQVERIPFEDEKIVYALNRFWPGFFSEKKKERGKKE